MRSGNRARTRLLERDAKPTTGSARLLTFFGEQLGAQLGVDGSLPASTEE